MVMSTDSVLLYSLLNGLTLYTITVNRTSTWWAGMVTTNRKEKVSATKRRTSTMFEYDTIILSNHQRGLCIIST